MKHDKTLHQPRQKRSSAESRLAAPPVSVIIVNYNYSQFIGDTIDALLSQTYPHFECVIVDNGSTDDSIEVARRHIGADPRFKLVALDRNLGHVGGALVGMEHTHHEFLAFVDADDVLMPTYLSAHLQAHLAAFLPIGLTCNNTFEIDQNNQLLSGSAGYFHGPLLVGACLPDISVAIRLEGVDEKEYEKIAKATCYLPQERIGWHWWPGTANMYRRSLIEIFKLQVNGEPVFGGVDCYLNHVIHAMTGTLFLTMPLSARRVHASNDYARIPRLANIGSGNEAADVRAVQLRERVLDHFLSLAKINFDFLPAHIFFGVIRHMRSSLGGRLDGYMERTTKIIAKRYSVMVEAYGERETLRQLRYNLPRKYVRRIVWSAPDTNLWRRYKLEKEEFRSLLKRGLRR